MDRADIQKGIEEAIQEIQAESGREAIKLTLQTVVVNPAFGFDSLNGIEACCLVEQKLGIKIDDHRNIFLDRDEQRAATLAEIVACVADLIEKGGK
jgi:acyl carrier protein